MRHEADRNQDRAAGSDIWAGGYATPAVALRGPRLRPPAARCRYDRAGRPPPPPLPMQPASGCKPADAAEQGLELDRVEPVEEQPRHGRQREEPPSPGDARAGGDLEDYHAGERRHGDRERHEVFGIERVAVENGEQRRLHQEQELGEQRDRQDHERQPAITAQPFTCASDSATGVAGSTGKSSSMRQLADGAILQLSQPSANV